MFVIDETTNAIKLTRGDTAKITVSFTDEQGDPYDFSEDTVTFAVKRSAFDAEPVIEKEIDSETGELVLQREDTIGLEFGDYLYTVTIEHTVEAESDDEVDAGSEAEDDSEETESEEEETVVEYYTPIVSKFSLGFNII